MKIKSTLIAILILICILASVYIIGEVINSVEDEKIRIIKAGVETGK